MLTKKMSLDEATLYYSQLSNLSESFEYLKSKELEAQVETKKSLVLLTLSNLKDILQRFLKEDIDASGIASWAQWVAVYVPYYIEYDPQDEELIQELVLTLTEYEDGDLGWITPEVARGMLQEIHTAQTQIN